MPIRDSEIFKEFQKNPIDYYNKRISAMKVERESFDAHWKDLAEYIQPRRGRFFVSERNKGTKKHSSIINSHATQALRTMTSGMLAGTMSPTRPWFSLETQDPEMMENQGVKEWLHLVEQILRAILNESNFYNMAPTLLSELGLFGTGCMSHEDDFEDVARFYTHTAGSYWIEQNERFVVDTVARKFEWTAAQIVRNFGFENLSTTIKTALDTGNYNSWFPVVHFVEPNDEFVPNSPLAQDKAFKSVYYEPGNNGEDKNKFLRQSGFDEFPFYVPRWDVTGEDIYATNCPAMVSLGDIRQLQIEEKRKAQGIDKMVNPPLSGPPTVRNVPVSSLPGGLTVYDGSNGTQQLSPIYQVNPQLQDLRIDIEAVERRIDTAFFVDLFLAISNMEGIQPRNQLDLTQRNEERLLQLGPVLERLQGDFLDQLIDRTFNQAARAQILPPIPDLLQGRELRIKYISTLAMAQRAVATQSIDRLVLHVGNLGQLGFVQAMEKFDAEQAIDEYAKAVGAPPGLVVPDDELEQIRAARAAQEQAQATLNAAEQTANIAKTASEADTDSKNALTDTLNG